MDSQQKAIYREMQFRKQLMQKEDKSCEVWGCERAAKLI